METKTWAPGRLVFRVEREPMWDGNRRFSTLWMFALQVEREPMWDGNCAISDRPANRIPVEREPMWDGNEASREGAFRLPPLSENQCGMET